MSIFVNTNVLPLGATRQVGNIQSSLTQSYERLSSGFRINSAKDDAAGLQISDRMTTQVNGLNQAVRNANDGISLVQTADGAMQEITTALQRMRVLAVQAQNGINSGSDLQAIQKEVAELKGEIDRIAETTQFAGQNLLDGQYSSQFLVGANAGQNITVSLATSRGFGTEEIGVGGLDVRTPDSPTIVDDDGGDLISLGTVPGGVFASVPSSSGVLTGLQVSVDNQGFVNLPSLNLPGGSGPNAIAIADAINLITDPTLIPGSASVAATGGNLLLSGNTISIAFKIGPTGDLATINSLTGISTNFLTSLSTNNFESNLSIIDGAISRIGSFRAELGALQNRFQSTIRNLSNIEENVQAARSRIKDTDYAVETAKLGKSQIVQQASLSVLAQANSRPQAALTLLQN